MILNTQMIEVGKLKNHPDNPRYINKEEFEALKKSITENAEYFNDRPCLASDRTGELVVYDGNMRLRAAIALGWTHVPCIVRTLTIEKERELIIRGNSQAGQWDSDLLSSSGIWEPQQLLDWGVPQSVVDFEPEKTQAEDAGAQEPLRVAISTPGSVWLLGAHRLMCGDSTDAAQIEKLMDGKKSCLMQTDPPYGIAYVEGAKSKGQSAAYDDIENDDLDGAKLQEFLEKCIRAAVPHLTENPAFYLWHPMLTQGTFFAAAAAAAAADILIHRQIIWVKPSLVFGRGDYHWRHELCFYGWIRGRRPVFYGERNQTTIWEIGRENDKIHPTQKPVELWEAPILNHSRPGQIIYDPFAGSGSQIIAAEKHGRICNAMEIMPNYVDSIIRRWQKFTGRQATHAETGEPFPADSPTPAN